MALGDNTTAGIPLGVPPPIKNFSQLLSGGQSLAARGLQKLKASTEVERLGEQPFPPTPFERDVRRVGAATGRGITRGAKAVGRVAALPGAGLLHGMQKASEYFVGQKLPALKAAEENIYEYYKDSSMDKPKPQKAAGIVPSKAASIVPPRAVVPEKEAVVERAEGVQKPFDPQRILSGIQRGLMEADTPFDTSFKSTPDEQREKALTNLDDAIEGMVEDERNYVTQTMRGGVIKKGGLKKEVQKRINELRIHRGTLRTGSVNLSTQLGARADIATAERQRKADEFIAKAQREDIRTPQAAIKFIAKNAKKVTDEETGVERMNYPDLLFMLSTLDTTPQLQMIIDQLNVMGASEEP